MGKAIRAPSAVSKQKYAPSILPEASLIAAIRLKKTPGSTGGKNKALAYKMVKASSKAKKLI